MKTIFKNLLFIITALTISIPVLSINSNNAVSLFRQQTAINSFRFFQNNKPQQRQVQNHFHPIPVIIAGTVAGIGKNCFDNYLASKTIKVPKTTIVQDIGWGLKLAGGFFTTLAFGSLILQGQNKETFKNGLVCSCIGIGGYLLENLPK